MIKKHLFMLFLVFAVNHAYCENNYRLSAFSVANGLSQSNIKYIFRDKYGYNWLCTEDGLNRYDGINNIIYRKDISDENSINASSFLCITQDERNNYWIGSDGDGFFCYDISKNKFLGYKLGNVNNSIREIIVEGSDKLWLLANNTMFLIKKPSENSKKISIVKTISVDESGTPIEINSVRNINHNIILCCKNGLKRIIHTNGKYELLSDVQFNGLDIIDIKQDRNDYLWVASNNELFRKVENKKVEKLETFNNDIIVSFDIDKSNNAWLYLNEKGLVRRNIAGRIEEIETNKNSFFTRNKINAIMIDNSENLWLCSKNRGLAKINLIENIFEHIKALKKFPIKNPTSILKDINNTMWIGTQYDGLLVTKDLDNYTRLLKSEEIKNIVQTNSKIWISTNEKLYMANTQSTSPTLVDVFAKCNIKNTEIGKFIICKSNNDIIWVITSHYLLKIEYINNSLHTKYFNYKINKPFVALEDKYTRLWIGTESNGLYVVKLNNNLVKEVTHFINKKNDDKSLSDNHIRSLTISRKENILIGTDNGLNSIKIKTLGFNKHFEFSNRILSITEDNTGILWLGTTRSLMRFDPQNLDIRIYNSNNGMITGFVSQASFIDQNGIIYIGSTDGIDEFDPRNININTNNPIPLINKFILNNKEIYAGDTINKRVLLNQPIQDTKTIKLKYNERNFSIEYIALQYNDIQSNRVAYMLEGIDNELVISNQASGIVQYSNLYPGKYKFILRARNNDGTWSKHDRELTIIIAKEPWLTIWAYLFYMIVIIIILFVTIKRIKEKNKLRQNLHLEQLNLKNEKWLTEEKSTFYSNISHEIKTPLTLIISPVKELSEYENLDDYIRKRVNIIKSNSDKLMSLINEFLEFRKIESQNSPLKVTFNNLSKFIMGLKVNFNHIAEEKNIRYVLVNEITNSYCWYDESKLSKVVNNLLSNAFKFVSEDGFIYLFISQTEANFTITVTDSGPGITINEQSKIFDRFYRMESSKNIDGIGIGLSLVKSIVQLHKGTIEIDSKENEGTAISVKIPCSEEDYTEEEKADNQEIEMDYNITPPYEVKGKPLIVIAEDNSEMANYIYESLSDMFNVRVFSNGNIAYENVIKLLPDLVISDVKMNNGDGLEFCKKMKDNLTVSHIPFILLTAMDSKEDVILGYKAGAEDYITKPFEMDALKLKVSNLIHFSIYDKTDKDLNSSKIPNRERTFIDKVIKLIEDNLDNQELNSEFICNKLAVSRMQLYRKLTVYLNKSVSSLIRDIRLNTAKKMLEENDFTVSEILYKVGFNNHSYFTKTFKEKYGMTPTDYLVQLQD